MIIWLASYPHSGSAYLRRLLVEGLGLPSDSIKLATLDRNSAKLDQWDKDDQLHLLETHSMPADDRPALYLAGDGRDCLTAQARELGANRPELLKNLIKNEGQIPSWSQHVSAWTQRPQTELFNLCDGGDHLDHLFQWLRKIGWPTLHSGRLSVDFAPAGSGLWKQEMSPEAHLLFWEFHGSGMEELGLSPLDSLIELHQQLWKAELPHHQAQKLLEQQQELAEKQAVIAGQNYRLQHPIKHILKYRLWPKVREKAPSSVIKKARVLKRIVRPAGVGTLAQHHPVSLRIPQRYHNEALPKMPPVISMVTPSFNQAQYLERTLQSVLSQDYPNLEYVVMDGGSNDQSPDIISAYASQLTHSESSSDDGQAQAINTGFRHTTGTIIGWLNSDDLLLPGSLRYVGRYFADHPDVDVLYGHRVLVNDMDQEVGRWVLPKHSDQVFLWADFIPQEAMFFRRRIWEKVGGLDESFEFALDWDLLLRFREAGARFARVPRFLGIFRVHPQQKTQVEIDGTGAKEMDRLRKRTHGRPLSAAECTQGYGNAIKQSRRLQSLYELGLLRH